MESKVTRLINIIDRAEGSFFVYLLKDGSYAVMHQGGKWIDTEFPTFEHAKQHITLRY